MRIRPFVIIGSLVLLAAWGLQFGAAPAAQAQQTCPAGQTYCPSGTYAGQCRPNTVACPTGSVSATVGGCSTCSCPGGQVVCSGACQAPKSCPYANRSTADQCAASDAASCGACAGGYTLDAGTNTCVLQAPVILAPLSAQERASDKSAINVVQGGTGLLFNLQTQSGTDGTTRKQVLSVDKSGLMVGYDPDAAKLGADFRNADGSFLAGGQNLIYGIAREAGLDPVLDALLLLQTRTGEGTIINRMKVTGTGDLTVSGFVRGDELCIGADCKSSWSAVAPAGVLLQGTTPGTQQTGNLNISGTARLGSLAFAGGSVVNLQGAQVSNATYIGGGGTPTSPSFLRFTQGDLVYAPTYTGVGRGLMVWHGAVDPTVVGYAKLWHDGTSTYVGDTTNAVDQALRITGPDVVVPGNETVGSLTLAVGGTVNLQSGDVVNTDTISAGATGTTRPFIDFNNGYVDVSPSNASWGFIVKNGDPAVPGYAHLWHNGTKVILNDENSNASQGIQLDGSNLAVSGTLDVAQSIQAGSGNVNIIDSTGRIPALSSTYLASLSGANLTSLNASNLASGTVADARLPAGLLRSPIEGSASDGTAPWLTIQGGASVLGNIALRLYDAGTADGNVNMLQFAHNGGSGPVLGAKIRSTNVGANAASGAKLTLETASNNTGTFNTNQLVLDRDGNVGVGLADPAVRLDVSGDVTATGDFTGKNTYECVNVGTELRCNLRQYWRIADKTSGYVESWAGSDTCTNICARAGLKVCTDIQFNYECPDGTLMQSWQDDDPGEFDPSERTCSSSEPYRATVSGVTCAGQSGTEYKRYRCRCAS